ncbi:U-Kazal-Dg21.2-like [Condylostylus longicornis]|uniref:U-Kazal-Dg21.2-like n=1 Tax=Condylostylus longicornis TaxID=2530218 RepID=UPI00244E0C7E|nr:U-Kazal-Dg21.2-like [Condylostylus longicornis]
MQSFAIPPECAFPCANIYNPLCTYNGRCYQTFGNSCVLASANCALPPESPKYEVVDSVECEYLPCAYFKLCVCDYACSTIYQPVCGYNGYCYKTFSNQCNFDNFNCRHSYQIVLPNEILGEGENCPEACTDIYAPVCAFNHQCYRTFGNECEVKAENCRLSKNEKKFKIVSVGECENHPCFSQNICECNMACILLYDPICAYNGNCFKTFSNGCFLNAHNCQNPYNYFVEQCHGECNALNYQPICEN